MTSPLTSDGKSTIASNLAVALTQAGIQVLLVDADFRRPSLHSLFGRPRFSDFGLAEVVRGESDPMQANLACEVDGLYVMTCGERPEVRPGCLPVQVSRRRLRCYANSMTT